MSLNASPRAFDALVKKDLDALARTSHDPAAVMARDLRQQTPLHWAIRLAIPGATDVLVKGGQADPNAQDQWGDTPLHLAIRHNRPLSEVQTLMKAGANPNVPNHGGQSPAYEALCRGNEAVFDLLVPKVTWDTAANADQQPLRQCVGRQRPAWQTKVSAAATLSAAVQNHGAIPAPAASVAPVASQRRSLTP